MTKLDRYLFAEATRRMALAAGIVLLALVLERVLRLFEFAADNGAAVVLVLQMTASLVPHYLGIALPAAFFITVLLLVARLGDDNEIDAMMCTGQSLTRLMRPLIVAALGLTVFSVLLYGFIDPYSRYGYRALRHAATHGAWTGTIEPQTFFTPSDRLTIYAGDVDLTDQTLKDVFVRQITDDNREIVTTATDGRLDLDFATGRANVILQDVVQVVTSAGQAPVTLRLREFRVDPSFPVEPEPYRDRGASVRELTLSELWALSQVSPGTPEMAGMMGETAGTLEERRAELHGRLARALSVLAMPFLAIPMGMAAKRQRRGLAIAVAAVLLVVYRNALELGGGLVARGTVSPAFGFWIPLGVFTLLCVALFIRLDRKPQQTIFEALFDTLDRWVDVVRRFFRRWKKGAA